MVYLLRFHRTEACMTAHPEAYTLAVPDEAITDLQERLGRTRFPDQAPGERWAYGTDLGYLQQLVEYWRTAFDWRAEEARLNAFPQFKLPLHGIDLHFLHVAGRGPDPTPLLLLHGWPGSVFEFLELIPRLTDPARFGGDPVDSFTVVAPSLPGYGLSFTPGQPRFGIAAIADCVTELMTTLGYPRFAVQGGDWGAFIASRLGYAHPDKLIGIHLNLLAVRRDQQAVSDPTPEEKGYLDQRAEWLRDETGYQWIQGTKPQTLAFALTDSPAGLAAWIIEKFRSWSDCGGDIETAFSRDRLLANISLYWFTGAIGSSFWPYYDVRHAAWPIPEDRTIDVPMGYAHFPAEILHPPRSLAARTYSNIHRWSVMPRGGHFAALEQPEALAREVSEFFRTLQS
jgi:pimeloyl-ACP methyl ester carboxylesterase